MNQIRHIFRKELRDMFRDKRVRSAVLFTPIMMMFVFVFIFGFLNQKLSEPSNIKVHVVRGVPEFEKILRVARLNVIEVSDHKEGEALIRSGDARLLLEFPTKLPTVNDFHAVTINAYFDPKQELSQIALGTVSRAFGAVNKIILQEVFDARGIPKDAAEPIKVVNNEIQVGGKGAGQMIIQLLPYLIVIWSFVGGMSIATELVAGEKEKNTLETLLISPVSRLQIALGKFLSLCVVCLIGSLSSFVGLLIVESLHLPMTKGLFPNGLGISFEAAVAILVMLAPTVALFASILLAISAYAKNPREAQTYLAFTSIVVTLPAMMSQFIGFTDFANSRLLYAIPVLNTATVIRQALLAKIDLAGLGVAVTISLLLAGVAMRIAIGLFNREQILTRI